MPITTDSFQSNQDELLEAYYESPEFKAYLATKAAWEELHATYVVTVDRATTAPVLLAAQDAMREALQVARRTPIHLSAFGW